MPEIRIRVHTDLRRALDAIATREHMTVRDLMVDAARLLVAAYHARDADRRATSPHNNVTPPRGLASTLETVWQPHRDAPSLLVDRPTLRANPTPTHALHMIADEKSQA